MDVQNATNLLQALRQESQLLSKQVSTPRHSIIAKSVLHGLHVLNSGAGGKASNGSHRTDQQEDDNMLAAVPSQLWVGLAIRPCQNHAVEIGLVCHDGTATIDFMVHMLHLSHAENEEFPLDLSIHGKAQALEGCVVNTLRTIARDNACRFVAAGIASDIIQACPSLPSRLWMELDILPIVLDRNFDRQDVDEIIDSMARKCVLPNLQPRLQIGALGEVGVDLGGRCAFVLPENYARIVGDRTTRMAIGYSQCLRRKQRRLAFFTASSQGEVARMRHALMRALNCLEVHCSWFVPPPKPEAARIHERIWQILSGEADLHEAFPEMYKETIDAWTVSIAKSQKWTADGGPLAPRNRGGAAIIVIDDFSMSGLVTIAKELDPTRTVILRSHHALRDDLITAHGTGAAQVWQWIWPHIKSADLFISEPMHTHIPRIISRQKLGLMVSSTDWLDGQNKRLSDEAIAFYHLDFAHHCQRQGAPHLAYPRRDYIIQIADFKSKTAMDDAIAAFALFRRQSRYCSRLDVSQTPQLLLCGYGSSDGTSLSQGLSHLRVSLTDEYADLKDDISISSLGSSDQIINALLTRAHVSLDLSQSNDFNVFVSQSLHKGVPCIARNSAGNALQIQHARTGFLVQGLDKQTEIRAVAQYLDTLFSDEERYYNMGFCARMQLSDEISSVGNAVCWMYLFDRLTSDHKPKFDGGWVWDMALEHAGERRHADDVELPRNIATL
ncbi:hypothetical protein LTR95_004406 [Oleoguttula sp. CCFEE 5521]